MEGHKSKSERKELDQLWRVEIIWNLNRILVKTKMGRQEREDGKGEWAKVLSRGMLGHGGKLVQKINLCYYKIRRNMAMSFQLFFLHHVSLTHWRTSKNCHAYMQRFKWSLILGSDFLGWGFFKGVGEKEREAERERKHNIKLWIIFCAI